MSDKAKSEKARVVETPDGEDLVDAEHGPTIEDVPALELAGEDVLIERPDLGPGAHTLIVAGAVIPRELAGLPRKPRSDRSG